MKTILTSLLVLFTAVAFAQEPASAQPGVKYGAKIKTKGAIEVAAIEQKIGDKTEWKGVITGEVIKVCEKKGCWMKLKTTNGDMMVKFKNYGFFMPKDIVGKTIVAEGIAKKVTTSVEELKHYAEDAGKTKEEIEAIKEPKTEINFEAKGVVVLK
jgi:hypothetical protein